MFFNECYLFLICLKLVSSFHLHTTSRVSGFVLVDNNFTYVEEIVPSTTESIERIPNTFSPNERDIINPNKVNVKFEPPILYFKDKVVGKSYRDTVYLINASQNKTIKLDKIFGDKHSQFQIALFGQEFIPPGGNTSFDIIFIGKDLVPLTTHYYIYTSIGIFKYDVITSCVENPYRITPMASIILPLNSSYIHSLVLRNPSPEPLLITEVLLHGGTHASHSLPPDADLGNARQTWTIPPYETKEILRVHFLAFEAWNLTTFQSIKLSTGIILLIPVDVEVIPKTGLYVPGHKIDFEGGGHLDPPAIRPLHLCSSAKKTVNIENISCESRTEGCEVVDFRPTVLAPWSCAVNPVANVKFAWSAKVPGEFTTGGLVIKNDLDPYFRINYTARIHHGGLTYNASMTHYVTGVPATCSGSRPFAFTNEYKELVAIMNVYLSFEAAEYFQIRGFEPSVLRPQEQKVLFNLQTRKGVRLSDLKLEGSILLETNISTIRLPLRVYDGLLQKLSKVAQSSLHVGLVSPKSPVVTYFGLANSNPETIFVKYFGSNDSSIRIELLDIRPGNARTFYYRSFLSNESGVLHAGGFNIHPNHYASFKVSVNTSETEEEVYADVWVQSDFEKLTFPFYMNVAKGFIRVSPDPFEFEDCFPGAFCAQQLTVESHFLKSMSIVNISTIPYTSYDKLLFYPNIPATIAGHATSIVGNVLWEPTIDSSQTWPLGYLGLPNNRTGRDRWLGTIERPNITRDFDLSLMESLYLRYREQYSSSIDLVFRMDTTEIRNYLFKGKIRLQWPQIVTTRVIDFPLVQIGMIAYENVTVFNPMHSHYMTVQVILAYHYQQEVPPVVETMISEFEEPGGVESKSNEYFLDMNITSPYRYTVLNGTKRRFTNHRSSIVFVLPPQTNATVKIGFMPSSQILTTTKLYLRNDFTILDSVVINGAGAYPQLTLEGLESSTGNLIKFVIPYETLRLCEESSNKVLNITTKKSFRLRNTGQVSVHIFGFTINGLLCQGYGFKITNCHNTPFVLKPGMSKRIEISFMPDFTSARVEANFQVESDVKMGPMLSYTLYAALDSDWLRKCKPHLQRPYWEPLVYYLMIGMFFFLLIGVAIMAVYEVSTHTNRLISGFGGVEQKVQPFYDLKLVEVFFIRSSFPHHHHHNHHHHRSSTTLAHMKMADVASKSEAVSNIIKQQQSHSSKSNCTYKEGTNVSNGSVYIPSESTCNGCTNNANVSNCDKSSPEKFCISSVAQNTFSTGSLVSGKASCSSTNCSSQSVCYTFNNLRSSSITNKWSGSNGGQASPEMHNSTEHAHRSRNNSLVEPLTGFIEESSCLKSRKGKKYDLEEVCYKSNWFKKKHAKREEKQNNNIAVAAPMTAAAVNVTTSTAVFTTATSTTTSTITMNATTVTTTTPTATITATPTLTTITATNTTTTSIATNSNNNKFLKNNWTRCIKDGNVKKETKLLDEKRCNCPEKCNNQHTVEVINTRKEVAQDLFTTNSSSHNVNPKCNKDVPRKLDFTKCGKKSSNNVNESALEVPLNVTEILSYVDDKETDNYSTKTVKQRRKKHSEMSNQKFNETTAKENIKENCVNKCKSPSGDKKSQKEAKNNVQNAYKKDQQKSQEPTEALKPITNLPKSKEPFETLSSLCNDTVSLKSKRKSNVKKRTKEEKFVNLARELSIVFTTPDTVDRKHTTNRSNAKSTNNSGGKRKTDVQKSLHESTSASSSTSKRNSNATAMNSESNNHNNFNDDGHGNIEGNSHTYAFIDGRNNSKGSINNGTLYSRVVAPPASRSSSSSSSSESTTSYDSSGVFTPKMAGIRTNSNMFWENWSSDMLCPGGIMPSNSSVFDRPTFNEIEMNRKIEACTQNLNAEIPEFVVLPDDNQNRPPEMMFCNPVFANKTEEYEINSDEMEDTEFYNFSKGSLSDEEELMMTPLETSPITKSVVNDIWGPPTSLFNWTPADLSGSPSNLSSDTVSAISLSRLLRFEEKKERVKEDTEQYRSLSSLWSTDTKSLWSHPKQE